MAKAVFLPLLLQSGIPDLDDSVDLASYHLNHPDFLTAYQPWTKTVAWSSLKKKEIARMKKIVPGTGRDRIRKDRCH
jgi:hypothetical protein